jgi:CheY-like chemotaxis protein
MRQALRLQRHFDVVVDVGDGASAIEEAKAHAPDVVVVDLGLPDLAGTELISRLRAAAPDARIVVYTGTAVDKSSAITQAVDAIVQKDRSVRYLVDLVADIGRAEPFSASIILKPETTAAGVARRFLDDYCVRWGCADALPRLRLVISELVTNALFHSGSECELRVRLSSGLLRIEVRDGGQGTPDLRDADDESEGGRGLLIVSSISQAWGVDSEADGKVVWSEVAVDA